MLRLATLKSQNRPKRHNSQAISIRHMGLRIGASIGQLRHVFSLAQDWAFLKRVMQYRDHAKPAKHEDRKGKSSRHGGPELIGAQSSQSEAL